MNQLTAQFSRIQQQFNALSSTQKMLAVSLVVIMVLTLWFWLRYASSPVMQPVLNQSFKEEDVARITAQLSAKGIRYEATADGRILVAADRRQEVLADLAYAQLLPRDTETGFNELMQQMSPWDSPQKNQVVFNRMKESYLAQIISRFPGVAQAGVIIDPREVRRVGNSIQPSATVNIVMRSGHDASKQLIQAAADTVAGAHAGLSRSRVTVIVNGASHLLKDADNAPFADSSSVIETRKQWENHYQDKIQSHLSNIRGALVTVSVKLNLQSRSGRSVEHDNDKSLHKERIVETTTVERTGPAPGGGEAGLAPNVGVAVGGGGASAGSSSIEERNKTEFALLPGSREESYTMPAGDAEVNSVSVRVPRSHYTALARLRSNGSDVSDEEVDKLIERELQAIRTAVKMATNISSDDQISVDSYLDLAPLLSSSTEVASSGSGLMALANGSGVKEIAVGALALVSLLMMGMMMRRSTAATVKPEKPLTQEVSELDVGETIAGEALEGSNMLDGMELDDDAVKTQQMLGQVETLVKENPEAAANLVKRWMNK